MGDPSAAPVRRRARHLMDPDAPRPVRDLRREQQSLTRVQRWVVSALAVTTILHLSFGLAVAAYFLPQPLPEAQIGLNVIAAGFGVVAVAAGLAVHARPILSPWLLLGVLPGLVGGLLLLV